MSNLKVILKDILNSNNEQNILLNELNSNLKTFINLQPKFQSLSDLATNLKKSNQTIKYHLITNYEAEKDFKLENGKIYVNSQIVPQIRSYYERKK
jgi:hypothetical protein